MQKISKAELLAILALAGVSSSNICLAANSEKANSNDPGTMGKVEHQRPTKLDDKNSACGKGSCGKDEKGAAAAKAKHGKGKADSKSAAKKSDSKSADKSDKK